MRRRFSWSLRRPWLYEQCSCCINMSNNKTYSTTSSSSFPAGLSVCWSRRRQRHYVSSQSSMDSLLLSKCHRPRMQSSITTTTIRCCSTPRVNVATTITPTPPGRIHLSPENDSGSNKQQQQFPLWPPCLEPYIRDCTNPFAVFRRYRRNNNNNRRYNNVTGFHVAFLGTGSSSAGLICANNNHHRGYAATVLQLGKFVPNSNDVPDTPTTSTFLFDAGEGTLRQLVNSSIHYGSINKIFITHMHGDHVLGLPGLVMAIDLATKTNSTSSLTHPFAHDNDDYDKNNNDDNDDNLVVPQPSPLQIIGPVGLYRYLVSSLMPLGAKINHRTIQVYELVNTVNLIPSHRTLIQYAEIPGITHHNISPNTDGTWTVPEPQHNNKANGTNNTSDNNSTSSSGIEIRITAAEVVHVPGMPCFGYCVEEVHNEQQHPGLLPVVVDSNQVVETNGVREKEKTGGVVALRSPGENINIKSDNDKKETWIHPKSSSCAAIVQARPKPQQQQQQQQSTRKFVLLGDSFFIPPVMARLCRNADILVHEATMAESDVDIAHVRGHSSPSMAGRFADSVHAKVLVLSHIGPKNHFNMNAVMQSAMAPIKNGITHVVAAHDYMEIVVPNGGFPIHEWRAQGINYDKTNTTAGTTNSACDDDVTSDDSLRRSATVSSMTTTTTTGVGVVEDDDDDDDDNNAFVGASSPYNKNEPDHERLKQSAQSWLTWLNK